MLKSISSFMIGLLTILLLLINSVFMPGIVTLLGLMRYLLPFTFWKHSMNWLIHNIFTPGWFLGNNLIIRLTANPHIEISGIGTLQRHGKYFLICNHQAFMDIALLYKVFGRRIPALVFFTKKQLLWSFPFVGWACWASGFPYMHRHSKTYLKKHPEKKYQDIETTKRCCERFKKYPVTMLSFLESTRFTTEKQRQQNSPYKHLLKPKASSFAFVLNSMSEPIPNIINATIIYPDGNNSCWDFVCGRIKRIIIHYEIIPIDKKLYADYANNRDTRVRFQNWLNQLWRTKDELIATHLHKQETNHD